MGKFEKLIVKLLSGASDRSFDFNDLLKIVTEAGFDLRISGSHHILTKAGVVEIINLQPNGRHAKPYQVKQVRELIVKYKLYTSIKTDENGDAE